MFGVPTNPDKTHVSVATTALRDAYPVSLRDWGMVITVEDADYKLVYNEASTDLADNDNWVEIATPSASGGSAGDIQVNNGSGGFSGGLGSMSASRTILPITSSQGGAGLRLNDGVNEFNDEYVRLLNATYGGGLLQANILNVANVKNSSVFIMEVQVQAVQTSGTPGSTGFTLKIVAAFRVTDAGLLAIIGASYLDPNYTFNNTGDSFTGTPSLDVNIGNSNVNLNINFTTAKTLRMTAWCKIKAVVHA